MRKTPTNNIAERCCVQGQQHNGNGSCLDNCESNGDPLLSVQLEKVLTIITPASPRAHLNQREDQFLSKSYDLTRSLLPDTLPNTYPPLSVSITRIFPNTYTSWEEMWNRCSANGGVEGAQIRRDRPRREKSEANVREIERIVL